MYSNFFKIIGNAVKLMYYRLYFWGETQILKCFYFYALIKRLAFVLNSSILTAISVITACIYLISITLIRIYLQI